MSHFPATPIRPERQRGERLRECVHLGGDKTHRGCSPKAPENRTKTFLGVRREKGVGKRNGGRKRKKKKKGQKKTLTNRDPTTIIAGFFPMASSVSISPFNNRSLWVFPFVISVIASVSPLQLQAKRKEALLARFHFFGFSSFGCPSLFSLSLSASWVVAGIDKNCAQTAITYLLCTFFS